MSTNSENIEAKLAAYVDGELDAPARSEIEAHLAGNAQHRALIDDLKRTRDMTRQMPRATVPIDISEMLSGQMERAALLGDVDIGVSSDAGSDSRWRQLGAIAAAVLVTTSLAAALYYALPSPKARPPVVAIVTPDVPPPAATPAAPSALSTATSTAGGPEEATSTSSALARNRDKFEPDAKNRTTGNADGSNAGALSNTAMSDRTSTTADAANGGVSPALPPPSMAGADLKLNNEAVAANSSDQIAQTRSTASDIASSPTIPMRSRTERGFAAIGTGDLADAALADAALLSANASMLRETSHRAGEPQPAAGHSEDAKSSPSMTASTAPAADAPVANATPTPVAPAREAVYVVLRSDDSSMASDQITQFLTARQIRYQQPMAIDEQQAATLAIDAMNAHGGKESREEAMPSSTQPIDKSATASSVLASNAAPVAPLSGLGSAAYQRGNGGGGSNGGRTDDQDTANASKAVSAEAQPGTATSTGNAGSGPATAVAGGGGMNVATAGAVANTGGDSINPTTQPQPLHSPIVARGMTRQQVAELHQSIASLATEPPRTLAEHNAALIAANGQLTLHKKDEAAADLSGQPRTQQSQSPSQSPSQAQAETASQFDQASRSQVAGMEAGLHGGQGAPANSAQSQQSPLPRPSAYAPATQQGAVGATPSTLPSPADLVKAKAAVDRNATLLGAGDTIRVRGKDVALGVEPIDEPSVVDANGNIDLPRVGSVPIAGLTIEQAVARLPKTLPNDPLKTELSWSIERIALAPADKPAASFDRSSVATATTLPAESSATTQPTADDRIDVVFLFREGRPALTPASTQPTTAATRPAH